MINYNIRHLIIDKVAFNRWKQNMNKVNILYDNILTCIRYRHYGFDNVYRIFDILLLGCLNCGHKDKNQYVIFRLFAEHTKIYYRECNMCHKKKYPLYIDKI